MRAHNGASLCRLKWEKAVRNRGFFPDGWAYFFPPLPCFSRHFPPFPTSFLFCGEAAKRSLEPKWERWEMEYWSRAEMRGRRRENWAKWANL